MKKDQEQQSAAKYTPSGKRKFKATVLSGSEKALSVFGRSSTTHEIPTDSDALARLKYRMANKDYRVEETSQEPPPFPIGQEKEYPKPEERERNLPKEGEAFEPTKEDFREEKE